MKVLFLNGSPNKNGSTARILKEIATTMESKHEIEWVDVCSLSVRPCMGCFRCRPDKECVLPEDDAQVVGRKIAAADLLIVGSPNYWGNMSGPLKTLFDRSVTVMETFTAGPFPKPRHRGKKAVIVTSSGSPWPLNQLATQSRGTVHTIKTVLTKGGFKIVAVINYGGAKPKEELPLKIVRRAKRIADKMI